MAVHMDQQLFIGDAMQGSPPRFPNPNQEKIISTPGAWQVEDPLQACTDDKDKLAARALQCSTTVRSIISPARSACSGESTPALSIPQPVSACFAEPG